MKLTPNRKCFSVFSHAFFIPYIRNPWIPFRIQGFKISKLSKTPHTKTGCLRLDRPFSNSSHVSAHGTKLSDRQFVAA